MKERYPIVKLSDCTPVINQDGTQLTTAAGDPIVFFKLEQFCWYYAVFVQDGKRYLLPLEPQPDYAQNKVEGKLFLE
jgi:hypothetical protein